MRHVRDGGDVDDPEGRVSRRFEENELRRLPLREAATASRSVKSAIATSMPKRVRPRMNRAKLLP